MAVYLISYDLVAPGRHYPQVHAAIKAINPQGWAKPLESVWLVKTNLSAEEVREAVKKGADANDKILVIGVTGQAAGYRLPEDVWKWINDNV